MMPKTITEAHKAPVPVPPGFDRDMSRSVMIRYDGFHTGRGAKILSVVSLRDMAKLSDNIEDLLPERSRLDGAMFFARATQGIMCYADTDKLESFIDNMIVRASREDIKVINAVGDLRLMTNQEGDMAPPSVPAYVALDLERVLFKDVVADFSKQRQRFETSMDRAQENGNENISPLSP